MKASKTASNRKKKAAKKKNKSVSFSPTSDTSDPVAADESMEEDEEEDDDDGDEEEAEEESALPTYRAIKELEQKLRGPKPLREGWTAASVVDNEDDHVYISVTCGTKDRTPPAHESNRNDE